MKLSEHSLITTKERQGTAVDAHVLLYPNCDCGWRGDSCDFQDQAQRRFDQHLNDEALTRSKDHRQAGFSNE